MKLREEEISMMMDLLFSYLMAILLIMVGNRSVSNRKSDNILLSAFSFFKQTSDVECIFLSF
jgi:hypothetical protein